MEVSHLPIIDWALGTRLAGNKEDLAAEMLDFFIGKVAKDIKHIRQLFCDQNYQELLYHVHKFHGAICYCGLPRLKTIVSKLETQLKSNITFEIPSLLDQLDQEVSLLLEHYEETTQK